MAQVKAFWMVALSAALLVTTMPVPARFLSPDPEPAEHENFNRYWYANNNPYTSVDPDGREAVCTGGSRTINCSSMLTCGADNLYVGGADCSAPSPERYDAESEQSARRTS